MLEPSRGIELSDSGLVCVPCVLCLQGAMCAIGTLLFPKWKALLKVRVWFPLGEGQAVGVWNSRECL